MKRIGIMTFYFAHNYGAVWQAYALKNYLDINGKNEVNFIQFIPKKLNVYYSLNPFNDLNSLRSIKSMFGKILRNPKKVYQYIKFEQFISTKLGCTIDLNALNKNYDIFITGSDQVWNDNITGEYDEYFLSFSNNSKKISYAASFGKQNISSSTKEKIDKYLPKFDAISVREQSGINLINEIIISKVSRVCDPVFLFSKQDWEKEIEKKKLINGEFILYYSLEANDKLFNKSILLSKELNIPIFGIHPQCFNYGREVKSLRSVGPLEFLWLIKNAKVVCSNSFHAVAFSIIFEKHLFHLPHITLGSRSKELLILLGIHEEDLENVLDISKTDKSKLNELIKNSKVFLEKNVL